MTIDHFAGGNLIREEGLDSIYECCLVDAQTSCGCCMFQAVCALNFTQIDASTALAANSQTNIYCVDLGRLVFRLGQGDFFTCFARTKISAVNPPTDGSMCVHS